MSECETRVFDARAFLRQAPNLPGVYRMYDANDNILYVGKAKNLKNRLSSYFRGSGLARRTQALVERIADVRYTTTTNETEALLLEQNLIKRLLPPFNILLRDDKSYPYIVLSDHPRHPSLTLRRIRRKKASYKGRYFGPYTSAHAVREALTTLQKGFGIRSCSDSYYSNRQRPCLQHQIGRCSAPCVDLVSEEQYATDMQHAVMFLQGKKPELMAALMKEMQQAADELDFERAGVLRDQITYLRKVQTHQGIEAGVASDVDVFAAVIDGGEALVYGVFVRDGQVIGSQSFHFKDIVNSVDDDESASEPEAALLRDFVAQYYLADHQVHGLPREIVTSSPIEDAEALSAAIREQSGLQIRLAHAVRQDRAQWLKLAQQNAQQQLTLKLDTQQAVAARWQQLSNTLGFETTMNRMECFDVSHTFGEATVASCVVFDESGPVKSQYRRFNITGVTAGDDYHAMEQALYRHYKRIKESEVGLPDLLIVDGGKGQLTMAEKVFQELAIDDVLLLGIAKGVTRKPGFETLILGYSGKIITLPSHSAALHLLQNIRDEAHRFAITGHRNKRNKKVGESVLEDIPGIGPKKRRDLLNYFGSVKGIAGASIEDLQKVQGVSQTLAKSLHNAFRE